MRNKYRGTCHTCSKDVSANEGFYDGGYVFCSEPIWNAPASKEGRTFFCLNRFNEVFGTSFESEQEVRGSLNQKEQESIQQTRENVRLALVNGGLVAAAEEARVRSLDAVIQKVLGSTPALNEMTWEQITDVRNELTRRSDARLRRESLQTWKDEDKCPRCGGAGGSDKWAFTGWTCNRCNGSGKF
jgi:hypothetical protein